MSTVNQVMSSLKKKGNEQRRQLFKRHGAGDKLYGVSVADMKVIAKTIKGRQDLALKWIDSAQNRVRYTMNGFVIVVGAYVKPLLKPAKATARKLGKVSVDMHGTSCKVPVALDYIGKIETAGRVGKKRKTIHC